MPFTLAHSAAALPLRRLRLIPSALVVGTLAPDFEYFLRLAPDEGFGHTIPGILVLTLPLALLVLWAFHQFVKDPVIALLPNSFRRRLVVSSSEFRVGGPGRFLSIVGAILLGIATHVIWDSFTHPTTWLYHHWLFLSRPLDMPFVGIVPCFKVLQHGSTIVGVAALSAWIVWWYRTTEPSTEVLVGFLSFARKITVVALVTSIAFLGAMARAVAKVGVPTDNFGLKKFIGIAVVTAIALAWWELVAYGLLSPAGVSSKLDAPTNPHS